MACSFLDSLAFPAALRSSSLVMKQSLIQSEVSRRIAPEGGVSNQNIDEIEVALRELGLSDDASLD
jgi:hypothetical protein